MKFSLLCLFCLSLSTVAQLPDWTQKIRQDHPRLFFNADTWEAVKSRALNEEKDWYASTLKRVQISCKTETATKPRDLGVDASKAAFVFRMTGEKKYRDHAVHCLKVAISHYEQRFSERKPVNWYSTSRVHAICAWDWLYNDLEETERRELLTRLVKVIDNVLTVRPRIYRENYSGYNTGFYGVRNCLWFIGCTGLGTGIESKKVEEWLLWGRQENEKLLAHRKLACGDDGGGASPTLGYIFGAYPWSEQNYFYTWLSATGENIAAQWPHSAWLANYVFWNWISAPQGPREYGYGDTPHTSNALTIWQLFTHMANIRHLYTAAFPKAAAMATFIQNSLPAKQQRYAGSFFIYPFLLTDSAKPVPSLDDLRQPHARFFENMGQVFMRSGNGYDDTYCLFSCDGKLRQHRHYDALNFVLYHRGYLALDSGTRWQEMENGEHLANYYAQTVAHNCVLIHQPQEPIAHYWGATNTLMYGGQHDQIGSVLKAFETNDQFVYVAGDATASYRHKGKALDGKTPLPQKAKQVTRQMVFLMPNHLIVFDRVTTTDAAYRKDWLLHTANQPEIQGNLVRADHEKGRMFCQTILPEKATLKAVGGPGNEFLTGEKNWELTKGLNPSQKAMMGQWRVEVSPEAARQEDLFLHVLEVGDQSREAPQPVEKLTGEGQVGVRVAGWEVLFATKGDLRGQIKGNNVNRALTNELAPQVGIATVEAPQKGLPLELKAGEDTKPPASKKKTLSEARKALPKRQLPPFWVGSGTKLGSVFESVKRGKLGILAKTPGKRLLTLVSYGTREATTRHANFNSAIGARKPEMFADRENRTHPVILLYGPAHGQNTEGVTGLANLIAIMETGRDLAGREQPTLQKLADQVRLLIIPSGNPDGLARFEPGSLHGLETEDLQFWGQGTRADDTLWGWPACKEHNPMTKGGFLGCYFNDAGVNIVQDEFFAPMAPETAALLKLARDEAPDTIVHFYGGGSHASLLRPAYLPLGVQQQISDFGALLKTRLTTAGLPVGNPPSLSFNDGNPPPTFNIISATYHTSGALSFGFNSPQGLKKNGNPPDITLTQILDIHLLFFEELLTQTLKQKGKK